MHSSFSACKANERLITCPFSRSNYSTMLIKTDFSYLGCFKEAQQKDVVTTVCWRIPEVFGKSSWSLQQGCCAHMGWGIPNSFQSCHGDKIGACSGWEVPPCPCILLSLKGVWVALRACGTPRKCDLQRCSLKTRLQSTNLPKCFCKQDFLPKVPWIRPHSCPNTSCDLAQPLLATCWAQSLTTPANVFCLSVGSAGFYATRREVIHLTKATHFYSFWKHFCCKNNKV